MKSEYRNGWNDGIKQYVQALRANVILPPPAEEHPEGYKRECRHHLWEYVESMSDNEVRCILCDEVGEYHESSNSVYYPCT